MSDSKVQTLKVITLASSTKQISHKEPMLVLHGWGMNSKAWDPIKEQLEESFAVTWLDLPGHGINNDVQANSLEEIVSLVSGLVTEPTHIMGWSLGGIIAQAVLEKLSAEDQKLDNIKTLTLVASSPRFSQADDWPFAMSLETLSKFADNTQNDLQGTIKRFIALQFMGVKPNENFDKKMQRELSNDIINQLPDTDTNSIHTNALKTGLEILETADLRSFSPSSSVSLHWILGVKDKLIPVDVANNLKLLRPDDQITLLENAGHAPFMTHPQEFLDALTRFIIGADTSGHHVR